MKFMRCCRQTQVFCGTAEPFVMVLSMIGVSGSAVAWIHYQKRWSLPYLTLLICAFYSRDDRFAAGTKVPVRTE
jgi:hypothetical protein